MTIKLNPEGNNYVLTVRSKGGAETKVALSDVDVLTLAQSAQSLQLDILRRRDPEGGNHLAVFVTDVSQFALSQESLRQAILMTLIAPNGNRLTYAIPEHLVEHLIQQFQQHLAQLHAKKMTRQ